MTDKHQSFLSWNIYQIYPRSFYDSNGDGIGDLQGIIQKLDYLKELGVNAIWLCPCYKSPNEDHGYDVADYRDIMDEFGTMEDMRELIRQIHLRDMKLIMDLVPNHTSSEHEWFRQSRKSKDSPYSDYYYWFDSPPNDWQSCFGGSAWAYDEHRKQYYLHSYAVGQPDLNWENPEVVRQMQDVVDFWIDMGADGFRIDVIDQISKDFEKNQNMFGPNLHSHIRALFGREKTRHIFTVGECWADDIEEVRRHIGEERQELSTLFQFEHLDCGRDPRDKFSSRPSNLQELWNTLSHWQKLMQREDLLHSLFTDNHDNGWLLNRVGNTGAMRYESATCIASMVYLLRGVPFIYQGQEFGMSDPHYESIRQFDDVESVNRYHMLCETMSPEEAMERINFGSRDNTRRPMCWSGEENGGFSDGAPWIPVHTDYRTRNCQADIASEKSIWRFYRDLLKLRNEIPALTLGSFTEISPKNGSYCAYCRQLEQEKILVICNFETEQQILLGGMEHTLLLSNYGFMLKPDHRFGPYEVAVYKIRG